MFSKIMDGLRTEAEKVAKTNAQMLAAHEQRVARSNIKTVAGAYAAVGGACLNVVGLLSPTILAADGALKMAAVASAAKSLGIVAVGASVFPVAQVVGLGVAVAGAAYMIYHGSGLSIKNNDYESVASFYSKARSDPDQRTGNASTSDWLIGAKNMMVKSLGDYFKKVRADEMYAGFAPALSCAQPAPFRGFAATAKTDQKMKMR